MKSRCAIAVLSPVVLSVLAVAVLAAVNTCDATIYEKTVSLTISDEDVYIAHESGYEVVRLENSFSTGTPGWPLVPSRLISVVLPQGSKLEAIELADARWVDLEGHHMLHPAQPPRPLSEGQHEFVAPSKEAYLAAGPFPAEPVRHTAMGNAGGFRLASLCITPVRYWPDEGRLAYLGSADILIAYTISGPPAAPRAAFQIHRVTEALRTLVVNPEDLLLCAPPVSHGGGAPAPGAGTLEATDEYRHVIITSESLASSVEPLSAWRTKHGYPSMVKTVEDIVAAYPGWDDAERLRNFIIDANATWGTLYFTLAGDIGVVPMRYVGDPASGPTGSFPCDLYFSDLDGTWDENGNHIYGEEADSLDLYSDVYVGRASIETIAEANTFVTKTLTYEKTPPAGYIENCLLPGVELWANYWGAFVNDSIAVVTPTPPWNDIKLYQRDGTVSRQAVIDAINAGVGYCHYSAHGNENGVYFAGGDTLFHSTDALALTNGNMLGLHNSIACIPGAFDGGEVLDDCLAEHLMNYPGGGAVACIMNSRVGLGTPPTMGPSEHLSLEFYHKVFDEDMHRAGMAHAMATDAWCGTGDWAYNFCLAELIYFGDAALQLWTAEPQVQTVEHPATAPTGPSSFTVTVQGGGSPLEGALVCVITPDGEVYHYGETDASGEITFDINPPEENTLHVTSTAPDHLPYEGSALIEGGSAGIPAGDLDALKTGFQVAGNPVVGSTTLRFSLREAGPVRIEVFDVSGRMIDEIVDRHYDSGIHTVRWEVSGGDRRPVAPGIYFVTFTTETYVITRQAVLLR
jgi:hypothetical protein